MESAVRTNAKVIEILKNDLPLLCRGGSNQ